MTTVESTNAASLPGLYAEAWRYAQRAIEELRERKVTKGSIENMRTIVELVAALDNLAAQAARTGGTVREAGQAPAPPGTTEARPRSKRPETDDAVDGMLDSLRGNTPNPPAAPDQSAAPEPVASEAPAPRPTTRPNTPLTREQRQALADEINAQRQSE